MLPSMTVYGWPNCPAAVRVQLEQFIGGVRQHVAELRGVYLHGSLALGCFNPARSDLDLLVATHAPLEPAAKHALGAMLLACSRQPTLVETSFMCHADLWPWRFPTPYDLHYSEMWRDQFAANVSDGSWHAWRVPPGRDPDLAAHLTVLHARGVCLWGEPISRVFPPVPPADYVASVLGDVQDALVHIARDPVYAVLNACRTVAWFRTGAVLSKDEGGVWALGALPPAIHGVIATALAAYRSASAASFAPGELATAQQILRVALYDAS